MDVGVRRVSLEERKRYHFCGCGDGGGWLQLQCSGASVADGNSYLPTPIFLNASNCYLVRCYMTFLHCDIHIFSVQMKTESGSVEVTS